MHYDVYTPSNERNVEAKGNEEILSEKVTNDAAAYARSLAERFGRNAEWAERAVRRSVSASAQEALGLHVIDLVAPDVPSLVTALEGRTLRTGTGEVTLRLQGARVVVTQLSPSERLLHGLHRLQSAHSALVTGVAGIAEMCFLHYATEELSQRAALAAAQRGLLFKRTAYNFVSLAHDDATVDKTLEILDEVLRSL